MALAISGSSIGHPSTVAAARAAKSRCRRRSARFSLLGIEFGGHAAVAGFGFQLGWDDALKTRGLHLLDWALRGHVRLRRRLPVDAARALGEQACARGAEGGEHANSR